ncbi:MAG TPA: hypothetical protein VFX70_13225 [Mycobacteriales bacterium]|nr:hypothetical protein [Mycobacteriales bacterium]
MQFTHFVRVSVVTAGLIGALGAGSAYALDPIGSATIPAGTPAAAMAAVPQLPTLPAVPANLPTVPVTADSAGALPTIPGLPNGDPTTAVTSVVNKAAAEGAGGSGVTGFGGDLPATVRAVRGTLPGTSLRSVPGDTATSTADAAVNAVHGMVAGSAPLSGSTLPGLDGLVAGLPAPTASGH